VQLLMEADVESVIDVGRHERMQRRETYRNRALDTRLGTLQPRIGRVPGRGVGAPPSTYLRFRFEERGAALTQTTLGANEARTSGFFQMWSATLGRIEAARRVCVRKSRLSSKPGS
jgi:hypothetical protein